MRDIGGADPQSAFLRAVVVGPAATPSLTVPPLTASSLAVSSLTVDLDLMLREAGHDVTLLTGAPVVGVVPDGLAAQAEPSWDRAPAPRAVPLLGWSRLDTWARTGRRVRGVDVIVLVHSGLSSVPALLALLHGAGASGSRDGGRPRMVLVAAEPLARPGRSGWTARRGWHVGNRLTAALVRRVDAVLVHDDEAAVVATGLGAERVSVTARPASRPEQSRGDPSGVMLGNSAGAWAISTLTAATPSARDVLATGRPGGAPAGGRGGPAGREVGDGREVQDGREIQDGREVGDGREVQGGRTRVAIGAVAREVRHGLALGSRFLSAGLVSRGMRQPPSQCLDLERARTGRVPVGRAPNGRATVWRATFGETGTAVGPAAVGPAAVGAQTVAPRTGRDDDDQDGALSAEWAHYVGVLESLASPYTSGSTHSGFSASGFSASGFIDSGFSPSGLPIDGAPTSGYCDAPGGVGPDPVGPLTVRLAVCMTVRTRAVVAGWRERVRADRTPRATVPMQRSDLPDWVVPTDVLVDAADGDEAKVVARELGLPRVRDGAEAWSALGALAAVIRIVDDGRRSAVVVDESGPRSTLTRWARAVGFAPVSLGLGGPRADLAAVDLEMETLDVIARVHPGGCDADDVDEIVASSSWLLRPGGILVVTIPLGPPGAPGAIAPADVRGVVARAHGFGFTLVGDLDGELSALMTGAAMTATSADTAYGLVRLTFRRQ